MIDRVRLNTEVLRADWDEEEALWRLELSGGSSAEAEYLVCATGQLSRPVWSRLPGIETFEGTQFHSANWDHDYELAGKRVGVIGTGASAIQFIPEVAPEVGRLTIFQRTPPWVIKKPERIYPAFLKRLFRRLPILMKLGRLRIYLNFELLNLGFIRFSSFRAVYRRWWRTQMKNGGTWDHPELRAKLTPDYEIGCKRALVTNDYYPALCRSNVDLIADPITEITAGSVITASGAEHELDALIHGTGFATHDFLAPMQVAGRGGTDLNEAWAGRRQRVPRHDRLGLSEHVHPLRAEHQSRRQLDRLHARVPVPPRAWLHRHRRPRRRQGNRALRRGTVADGRDNPDRSRPHGLEQRLHELVRRRDRTQHQQLAVHDPLLPAPDGPRRHGRLLTRHG